MSLPPFARTPAPGATPRQPLPPSVERVRRDGTYDGDLGDDLKLTAAGWYPMVAYQEMVKFTNKAIAWENFLYPYFWDGPESWAIIRQTSYLDIRQALLPAGSARVVLTVRHGWEHAWTTFVEAGSGDLLPPDHPYMTIAQEIAAYDATYYPCIQPANPGGGPLPDSGQSVASQSSDKLSSSPAPVNISGASSVGFLVCYTAINDDYSSGSVVDGVVVTVRENLTIMAVPDAKHITVERLDNANDGSQKPLPVIQSGEKGQLVAELVEYTPTSGTDISVTSNLTMIA